MASKTLFFALWPDDRQRDRMRDFIAPVTKLVDGRAVDRREWHVTLVYIGDLDERYIPELQQAASAVTFEPFRLRLDRMEFWPRPKIAAMVPPRVPSELEKLVEDLSGIVFAAGVEVQQRVYRPHVTVVRNARTFETERLPQSASTEWSKFELIESIRDRGSVIYRPLDNDF
ncbi:MAG: RNA 2',3'-cyclic phosphodiesterase [Woeseiaceae bacterium]